MKTEVIAPGARRPGRQGRRNPAQVPLLFCPFTGRTYTVRHVPGMGSWIATYGRYVFGPFRTKGELFVAVSTRDGVPPAFDAGRAETLQPLFHMPDSMAKSAVNEPLELCPFTRAPISIVKENPDDVLSRWVIRGDRYFIGGFQTERHAQHYFSTRYGIPPTFDVSIVSRVSVSEEPEDALEGLNVAELKSTLSEATR